MASRTRFTACSSYSRNSTQSLVIHWESTLAPSLAQRPAHFLTQVIHMTKNLMKWQKSSKSTSTGWTHQPGSFSQIKMVGLRKLVLLITICQCTHKFCRAHSLGFLARSTRRIVHFPAVTQCTTISFTHGNRKFFHIRDHSTGKARNLCLSKRTQFGKITNN